jgi:hypothetical protein
VHNDLISCPASALDNAFHHGIGFTASYYVLAFPYEMFAMEEFHESAVNEIQYAFRGID